jgi:uncharacterized protein (DUF1778 family)
MPSSRTALLIRCSPDDARSVHEHAEREHRTISGYLLNILDRAVVTEERLFRGLSHDHQLSPLPNRVPAQDAGPRTAMLLRCSRLQAKQIRVAAQRQNTSMSNFVLLCLTRVWTLEDSHAHLPRPPAPPSPWGSTLPPRTNSF